ncbi:MAG: YCF48-related protein, partial [Pseudomonadota bacterium]
FETAEQSLAYGPAWPLLDVLFTDPATAWVAGAYGILFRSGDAGETWELVADRLDNFEDLHLNALHQSGAGSLVIAGEGGMLFRSADAGASFERFDTNDALSLFGLAEADGRLYAYGFGNSFQVSEDDGVTWASQRLPDNLLLIGDVALPLGGVGLLGGSGLMIPVGPEGAATPTRPTGTRDFLSGAVPGPEGLIFASEAGLLVADPGQGN